MGIEGAGLSVRVRAREMILVCWGRLVSTGILWGGEKEGVTNKILASLFRRRRKKPICMPKTTNEAAMAVTKATRPMPLASRAAPAPSSGVVLIVGDGWASRAAIWTT